MLRMTDLQALISKLEQVEEGGRELDLQIERMIVGSVPLHWRVGSGGVILSGFDDVSESVPRYTTSIDAKLPGENIHGTQRLPGGWRAYHCDEDGNSAYAFAKTEPLARRLAALKAMADE